MKFFITIILIALLSFAACLYLPWWSIAIVAFLVTVLINQKPLPSFLAGFIAVFILWTILAAVISSANEHALVQKFSMLILKSNTSSLLIILTGFIGGLVAGLGALTGSFMRKRAKA
ncbi:MAG TPA: hypothetical protein PK504_13530 [Ferruginibacter sp.]|nr:hypothetical protein [Ferruginibacter sp.]HRE62853.1 hypothetical protein [Ferruginibacter sp.]